MSQIELKYTVKVPLICGLSLSKPKTELFEIQSPIRVTESSGNSPVVIDLSELQIKEIPRRLERLSKRKRFDLVRVRPSREELKAYNNHSAEAPLRSGITHTPLSRFAQKAESSDGLRLRIYHALD